MAIVHAVGCTANRPEINHMSIIDPGIDSGQVREASIGENIRVTLVDGSVYSGLVLDLSEKKLVVGITGDLGYQEKTILRSNIEKLEEEGAREPSDHYAGAAGILLLGILAIFAFVPGSI